MLPEKIKKPNGKIYLRHRFSFENQNFILSLGRMRNASDYATAQNLIDELQSAIASGTFDGNLEPFKRRQTAITRGTLGAALALPDENIKATTIKHLRQYGEIKTITRARHFIANLPLAVSTRKRILSFLKRANPLLFANVEIKEQSTPSLPVIYQPLEIERLLHDLETQDPAYFGIVRILAELGLRTGEGLALNIGDFDYQTRKLIIRRNLTKAGVLKPTKNRLIRTLVVSEKLASIIVSQPSYLPTHPGDHRYDNCPIFQDIRHTSGRLSYQNLRLHFKASCTRSAVEYRGLYALRRACITNLVNQGHPISEVARFAGHTPAVLMRNYLSHYEQTEAYDTLLF